MEIGVIVAAIVAYIAWQQYKIERNKLRLAFYDRRLKVFEGFMELWNAILQAGKVSTETWGKYKNSTTEASFLFGSDILDFKKLVDLKALNLLIAQEHLKDLPKGEKRSAKAKEIHELLTWFTGQVVGIRGRFENYLQFEKIEQPSRPWLIVVFVVLGILTIWANYNQTGRYAFFQNPSGGGLFILDTRTSQIWGRTSTKMVYMGTIKNPKRIEELVSIESNNDQ